jgi:hypothetical protein
MSGHERAEGAGVRTPIRFGAAVERGMRVKMASWEPIETPESSEYLVYMFGRKVVKDWNGFVLIQGARRAGRFTVEVAISKRAVYPIHAGRLRPVYAVDGVRERLAFLQDADDFWWEYRTQETLEERLREALNDVYVRAHMFLDDKCGALINQEYERGARLMRTWREQDAAHCARPLGSRYPDLMMEAQAFEYIQTNLLYDSLNRCLGRLRARYLDERWFACHVYCMSSLLEMTNLGDLDDLMDKGPETAGDIIEVLRGRAPSYQYLKAPDAFEERMKRYSFFKALEIMDVFFDAGDL